MNNEIMPKCYNEKTKPHKFCPGCGHAIILKQLGLAIDELGISKNTFFCIDIGCSLLAWNFYNIDTVQSHHGRSIPLAIGYKKALPKRHTIAYMGDGGAYAIGLQSLIHAAFRNDPISAIVVNNTNYAMTGGQMAPTTFPGEITTTTPMGKKNIGFGDHFLGPELLSNIASQNASIIRSSLSNPRLVKNDIIKTINNTQKGNFSFLEILSICPTNWKTNAKESFEFLGKMESLFPVKDFRNNEGKSK